MKTQNFASWFLIVATFVTTARGDNSQHREATAAPAWQPASRPVVGKEHASHRFLLIAFLLAVQEEKLDDAAAFMDLRALDDIRRGEEGPELAGKLGALIEDRSPRFEPDLCPDHPDHAHDNAQFRFVLTVAKNPEGDDIEEIVLVCDDELCWRFSSETTAAIPAMCKQMREKLRTQAMVANDKPPRGEMIHRSQASSFRSRIFDLPRFVWLKAES